MTIYDDMYISSYNFYNDYLQLSLSVGTIIPNLRK